MEYPFKDLLPLDEVLEREGYYKDWAHLDPEVFYSLTQISEYIKTKGYGVDVRLLIAQLAEHFGLKSTQIIDLANLLQQKFDNLEGVTQSFTDNINSLVAQMEADKNAVIANATVDSEVILARGGKPTLGARLDETTAQLAQNALKTKGVISIEEFGAVGDYDFLTNEGTDNTTFINNASSQLSQEDTLLIPEGYFLIKEKINLHSNVDFRGVLVIPSEIEGEFISFPKGKELNYSASEIFETLEKGSTHLEVKTNSPVSASNLTNYYVTFESSEIAITRILNDSTSQYNKNESNGFVSAENNIISLKTPLLYTFNNLSSVNVSLSKKSAFRTINNMKIIRTKGLTEEYNQQLVVIRGNNYKFTNTNIVNLGSPLKHGITLQKAHNLYFEGIEITDTEGDIPDDTYAILNNISSYINIDGYTYISTIETGVRGYSGVFGAHVRIINSDLLGLDDHWGHVYEIDQSRIGETGISYAGADFKIKNSTIFDPFSAFNLRSDTPYAEGYLIFDNVDFMGTNRVINLQINGGQYNKPLKMFDRIIIENCRRVGSEIYSNPVLINAGIGSGSYAETVELGDITIRNSDLDSAAIFLTQHVLFSINTISFKNIEWYKATSGQNTQSFLRVNGEHTIKEIKISNSNDGGVYVDHATHGLPTIEKITYENMNFKDTSIRFIHATALLDSLLTYKNCTFEKVWGHVLINFKLKITENVFDSMVAKILTKDASSTGELVLSQNNVSTLPTNLNNVPQLTNYINSNFYKVE